MIEITMRIPLEGRQYKIPTNVAEQAISQFNNVPILYGDPTDSLLNRPVIGAAVIGKIDGDSIVVDGYLFKDAAIEFLKFGDLYSPSSIEICSIKRQ